ncbi:MAG: hypothetical protein IJR85_11390 [Synergistaceae bacterium]|nr:hypothetical protein [Synergistaceae bacterium]
MTVKKILLACAMVVLCCQSVIAEDYEVAGLWNIKGTGFVEKSFLRISLELDGDMTLTTATTQEVKDNVVSRDLVSDDLLSGDLKFLTAYDINLKISATTAGITAWKDHIPNGIRVPVPLPEMAPSKEMPYTLPIAIENEGLTYQVTLTSSESGKVRITGIIDFDEISGVEINSDCAFWKAGTKMPALEEETDSGCNSGFGALMLLLVYAGVKKIVWN